MLFRWLNGYSLSLLLMPSQLKSKTDESFILKRKSRDTAFVEIRNHNTPSTKGATIDFCELKNKTAKPIPAKDQKVIIHAVGNADCYENHIEDYIMFAEENPQYQLIAFNFRGTLASKGQAYSEQDWIDDALSMIRYCKNKGIQTENILLNGHSMGGALVTLAAAQQYQQDRANNKTAKSVKLINNRSFSTLTEEILVTVLKHSGCALLAGLIYGGLLSMGIGLALLPTLAATSAALYLTGFITEKFTQALLRPLIQAFLWLSFGTLDAVSAYRSLPEDCVDHIVAKNDSVIRDQAGMHAALSPALKDKKAELRKKIEQEADHQKKALLKNALINLKDSKLQYSFDPEDGHNAHVSSLGMFLTYHKLREKPLSGDLVMANKIGRLFKAKVN